MYFGFKKNSPKTNQSWSSNPLEPLKWKLSSAGSNHITQPSYIIALLTLSLGTVYVLLLCLQLSTSSDKSNQKVYGPLSLSLSLSLIHFQSLLFPSSSSDLITASALYFSASQSPSTRFSLSLSLCNFVQYYDSCTENPVC